MGNHGTAKPEAKALPDALQRPESYARSAAAGKPLETADTQSQRLKAGMTAHARSATGYFASEQSCKERKNMYEDLQDPA